MPAEAALSVPQLLARFSTESSHQVRRQGSGLRSRSYFRTFDVFARHGLAALPATPEVVGAYLAAAGEGYAMQTLRRRVAAIARASGVTGHPLDTKHPAIRETLRGIGRTHGSRGRRSAALTTEELKKLSRVCEPGLGGDRDRASMLTGFAGALRLGVGGAGC